jgi:hypothetical protein
MALSKASQRKVNKAMQLASKRTKTAPMTFKAGYGQGIKAQFVRG